MRQFNKFERYAAFLMAYLPRLAAVGVFGPGQDVTARSPLLGRTLEVVGDRPGLCLEFGVYKGGTITFAAQKLPKRHFYGFDSFEGLPTDGRSDWPRDFSVPVLPTVPSNVTLIKGWFENTLPPFLAEHGESVAYLNIDCDIYSSTKQIFDQLVLHKRLVPGTVIHLDEGINYDRYLWNEMLALFEMLDATGFGLNWIAVHKNVRTLEETLHLLETKTHPDWPTSYAAGYYMSASLELTAESLDWSMLRIPHMEARIRHLGRRIESASALTQQATV